MVADQHRRPRRPALLEPAAAVGEHDRAAAGRRRRTHAVHDGLDALALVVVGAAQEDQRPDAADVDRADLAGVARRRRPRRSPGRSVALISAVAGPSASTAGSQPEPSTIATSWRSTPVSSASRAAAASAASYGVWSVTATERCPGRPSLDACSITSASTAPTCAPPPRSTTTSSAALGHRGSWTSAWPSATAPTSRTSGSRRSRACGPTARCTSPSRRPTPTTVRAFVEAARARGAEVLHEPRLWPEYHDGVLRRLRPRPRRQQRRGGLPHRGDG